MPRSRDRDTIPSLLHLFIGATNEIGAGPNKAFVGLSYASIFKLSEDKANAVTKKNVGALIAEFGYARYFPKSQSVLKIMFSPIIIGAAYKKFESVPFGLSYGMIF